jgi:predicted nucleotide-binding protein
MLQVSVPIAHELLAQYVTQGQALVQRATLVGDFSDYESWKAARKQWIEPSVQALEHVYGGPKQAEEFKRAVTPSEGGARWQQQYAIDLDCVRAACDLLTVLQGELAFARPGSGSVAPAAELTAGDEVRAERLGEPGGATDGGPRNGGAPNGRVPDGGARDADAYGAREITQDPPPEMPPAGDAHDAQTALQTMHEEQPGGAAEPLERLAEDAAATQPQHRGGELSPAPIVGSELAPHADDALSAAPAVFAPVPSGTKQVFLAHGRNETWRQAVASLLERTGPHEVMILNERPNERSTLVEQFGAHAPGSRYAVVLLTADDVGAPRLESEHEPYFSPRARQGVVFEMGFLVAALTPGCVCVLYEDGVELPCDLEGIAYVRLDLAGTWQPKLLLHLRKAGFDYDLNKLAAV